MATTGPSPSSSSMKSSGSFPPPKPPRCVTRACCPIASNSHPGQMRHPLPALGEGTAIAMRSPLFKIDRGAGGAGELLRCYHLIDRAVEIDDVGFAVGTLAEAADGEPGFDGIRCLPVVVGVAGQSPEQTGAIVAKDVDAVETWDNVSLDDNASRH